MTLIHSKFVEQVKNIIFVFNFRDVLTANTTETEFKQVLEGLCKQTKSFKAECLSIADEYYDKIYETLTKNLDPEGACFFVGVCPKGVGAALPNVIHFMDTNS